MKKGLTWILGGVLSLSCALIAQAAEMSGATEKAVAALEQKFAQVQRENKTELEASMLADNFIWVDTDGTVYNLSQSSAEEKATKYSGVDIEDMHVTVFGDTAIAITLMRMKGTDDKGKPFDNHTRYTDTWVKMPDGKWRLAASAGTSVKK